MPKGDWGHPGYARSTERRRLFPDLEQTPDLRRGEIRFASEVLLAALSHEPVPAPIIERACEIADVMARG